MARAAPPQLADDSGELTLDEGRMLVAAARHEIERALSSTPSKPLLPPSPLFQKVRGLFVSLHTYPTHDLRGCIGFPIADAPLSLLLPEAARAAALSDPRFEPVTREEWGSLVVEVSVLTPPKKMTETTATAIEKAVHPGRDGLIIQYGSRSGLLLPQVAMEWNFTPRQFLEAVCKKAGVPPLMWKSVSARLYTFSAQVFSEEKPGEPAARQKLIRS